MPTTFFSLSAECQRSGTTGRQTGERIAGPGDPVDMHDGTSMCGRASTTAAVKHTRYYNNSNGEYIERTDDRDNNNATGNKVYAFR